MILLFVQKAQRADFSQTFNNAEIPFNVPELLPDCSYFLCIRRLLFEIFRKSLRAVSVGCFFRLPIWGECKTSIISSPRLLTLLSSHISVGKCMSAGAQVVSSISFPLVGFRHLRFYTICFPCGCSFILWGHRQISLAWGLSSRYFIDDVLAQAFPEMYCIIDGSKGALYVKASRPMKYCIYGFQLSPEQFLCQTGFSDSG